MKTLVWGKPSTWLTSLLGLGQRAPSFLILVYFSHGAWGWELIGSYFLLLAGKENKRE